MDYFVAPWKTDIYSDNSKDIWKQFSLCLREGLDSYLISTAYSTTFQLTTRKFGVAAFRNWNVFKQLQVGDEQRAVQPIPLRQFDWPEGIEFVYLPTKVIAMLNNQVYGKISLSSYDFIEKIELLSGEQRNCEFYIDETGFISSRVDFTGNRPIKRTYFRPNGDWIIKEDLEHQITLMNHILFPQYQEEYATIDELIMDVMNEVFNEYWQEGDSLTLAADDFNLRCFERWLTESPIYSFLSQRKILENELLQISTETPQVIWDFEETRKRISTRWPRMNDRQLLPYDLELILGESNEIPFRSIFVQLGTDVEVNVSVVEKMIDELGRLEEDVVLYVNEKTMGESFFRIDEIDHTTNITIEKINMEQVVDIIPVMKKCRLLVDLSLTEHREIQLLALRMCIPIVATEKTEFLLVGQNGRNADTVKGIVDYTLNYLTDFSVWNQVLMFSIDFLDQISNTTGY